MARLDRLTQHVRVVAAQPVDLLFDPAVDALHQLPIAAIPRDVAAHELPGTRSLVASMVWLPIGLGIARRQLAMPIDDWR